jgi:ribonuclease HII
MITIGVDETGRGSLLGPVICSAMAFPAGISPLLISRLRDSKVLSPKVRRAIAADIAVSGALYTFGAASAIEVDRLNPLAATMLAMRRAVCRLRLPPGPAVVLVDGNRLPEGLPYPGQAIIRGDSLIPEIMAASIVAKVLRDRCIAGLAGRHPGFGMERNAGYGTAEHLSAVAEKGPSPHHRLTFLRKIMSVPQVN